MIKIIQPKPLFLQSLGDLPLFKGMTPEEQQALLSCAQITTCKAGDLLFREGDLASGFFILKCGRVKMRRITTSGREIVLHLSTPPHMIGCKGLTMPGSRYPADAVALEDVIALGFSREQFMVQAADKPELIFSLLVKLNYRLSEIYTLQAAMATPTEQRIATLLYNQALPEDAPQNNLPAPVRLTKSLIAAIVGTTTETAIRILSRWNKAGLVSSERGMIRLLMPNEILRISKGLHTPTCSAHADCENCKLSTCPSLVASHQCREAVAT